MEGRQVDRLPPRLAWQSVKWAVPLFGRSKASKVVDWSARLGPEPKVRKGGGREAGRAF